MIKLVSIPHRYGTPNFGDDDVTAVAVFVSIPHRYGTPLIVIATKMHSAKVSIPHRYGTPTVNSRLSRLPVFILQ